MDSHKEESGPGPNAVPRRLPWAASALPIPGPSTWTFLHGLVTPSKPLTYCQSALAGNHPPPHTPLTDTHSLPIYMGLFLPAPKHRYMYFTPQNQWVIHHSSNEFGKAQIRPWSWLHFCPSGKIFLGDRRINTIETQEPSQTKPQQFITWGPGEL